MSDRLIPLSVLLVTLALSGCTSETATLPTARLDVQVAPLALTGITDATYRLTVRNADPPPNNIVWQRDGLTSIQFGDGQGSLSYVGPCDTTGNPHVVELELLSLTDTSGPLTSPADFVNPAPPGSPIRLTGVTCRENADTAVVIDLTIVRSAGQGFFDFAVNFDDIFCSAKLDCRDALLHDGDIRRPTIVLAFACSAGPGDPTFMYLSDLTLTCGDADGSNPTTTTFPVLGLPLGQQGPRGTYVFDWAQYWGREFEDLGDFEKCFWNFAVGLDTTALANKRCTFSAFGTASGAPLPGLTIPKAGAYPFIRWDGEVISPTGDLCTNQALGVSGSAVSTDYVTFATPAGSLPRLTAERRCGDAPPIACGTDTPVGEVSVVPGEGGAFTVEVQGEGGTGTGAFTLADGWSVATACCESACCGP